MLHKFHILLNWVGWHNATLPFTKAKQMKINEEIRQKSNYYITWKDWFNELIAATAFIILGFIFLFKEFGIGIHKAYRVIKEYIILMNKELEQLWK